MGYSMKKTVSILLVLMMLCPVFAAGAERFYIRENITWGMSSAKVQRYEGKTKLHKPEKGLRWLEYKQTEVSGFTMNLEYYFSDNRLVTARHLKTYKLKEIEDAAKDQQKLLTEYKKTYGKPVKDDKGYKAVGSVIYAYARLQGYSVSKKKCIAAAKKLTAWLLDDTVIYITDGYDRKADVLSIVIWYMDRSIAKK